MLGGHGVDDDPSDRLQPGQGAFLVNASEGRYSRSPLPPFHRSPLKKAAEI
jgi:hypothetical protein